MSKEQNYFYCLARQETCGWDMFGKVACAECKRSGDCRICGRQETTFCEKCKNRRFENDKASTTL